MTDAAEFLIMNVPEIPEYLVEKKLTESYDDSDKLAKEVLSDIEYLIYLEGQAKISIDEIFKNFSGREWILVLNSIRKDVRMLMQIGTISSVFNIVNKMEKETDSIEKLSEQLSDKDLKNPESLQKNLEIVRELDGIENEYNSFGRSIFCKSWDDRGKPVRYIKYAIYEDIKDEFLQGV